MSEFDNIFTDKIADTCFNLYNKIPKSGKPTENEWTVLSCIVKYDKISKEIEVVSLGTGSKCIGATKMSSNGDILNDSHAEVFARRGFLLYLYENINNAIGKYNSIFSSSSESYFEVKENVEFILYSSQLPCGDASIFPKSGNDEQFGDIVNKQKHKLEDSCEIECKRNKIEDDIHRTGAKCLPNSEQDKKESGTNYHTLGLVRTKPGRGDRTLSVSCSDKIARWSRLGIQGSLLTLFIKPIFINHYIFGSGIPYLNTESLDRAILNRNSDYSFIKPDIPKFYKTSLSFQHIKTETCPRPAAASIVWVRLNTPISEVAVQGRKLGITKKKVLSPINSLCISKYNLYKRFLDILRENKEIKQAILKDNSVESIPYNAMKKKAENYYKQWFEVKEKFFKIWTAKPDMWDFCIQSS